MICASIHIAALMNCYLHSFEFLMNWPAFCCPFVPLVWASRCSFGKFRCLFSACCPKTLLHLTSHKELTYNKSTLCYQSCSAWWETTSWFGHIVLSRVSQFTGLSCPSQTIPFGMPVSTVTTVFVGWIVSDPRFHSGVHVQKEKC